MQTTVREYFDNNPARMDLGGIVPVEYRGDEIQKWIEKDSMGRLSVWVSPKDPNMILRTEIGLDASNLILEGIFDKLIVILKGMDFGGKDLILIRRDLHPENSHDEVSQTDNNVEHDLF